MKKQKDGQDAKYVMLPEYIGDPHDLIRRIERLRTALKQITEGPERARRIAKEALKADV